MYSAFSIIREELKFSLNQYKHPCMDSQRHLFSLFWYKWCLKRKFPQKEKEEMLTVDDWYEWHRMILRNDAIIQFIIKWSIHNVHHIQ